MEQHCRLHPRALRCVKFSVRGRGNLHRQNSFVVRSFPCPYPPSLTPRSTRRQKTDTADMQHTPWTLHIHQQKANPSKNTSQTKLATDIFFWVCCVSYAYKISCVSSLTWHWHTETYCVHSSCENEICVVSTKKDHTNSMKVNEIFFY